MAALLRKREKRHRDLVDQYYAMLNEAEKFRDQENAAAVTIQKDWRMLKVKWTFEDKKRATQKIQRIWRGYVGRCHFTNKKQGEMEQKQSKFFHEQAKIIQKYYRGYYSRKYEHDFYARKSYLQHVQTKNEEVRKQLEEFQKRAALEEAKLQEQTARTEFHELASNLHHLASTKAVAGVYNPPYSSLKPQAFNVDIETHLKSTFKSNYTWKPPSKEKIEFFRQLTKEQIRKMEQMRLSVK